MTFRDWTLSAIAVGVLSSSFYPSVIVWLLNEREYPFDNINFAIAYALRSLAGVALFMSVFAPTSNARRQPSHDTTAGTEGTK